MDDKRAAVHKVTSEAVMAAGEKFEQLLARSGTPDDPALAFMAAVVRSAGKTIAAWEDEEAPLLEITPWDLYVAAAVSAGKGAAGAVELAGILLAARAEVAKRGGI